MTTQNPPSPNDPLSKGAKIADIKVLSDKAYHVSKCHDHINLWSADLEPLNESSCQNKENSHRIAGTT